MNPLEWIKQNKLSALLIALVLLLFVYKTPIARPLMMRSGSNTMESFSYSTAPSAGMGGVMVNMMDGSASLKAIPSMAPAPMVDTYYAGSTNPAAVDRRVVTENTISLQVSDVPAAISKISADAQALGGFMVSSNVSKPVEAANGFITVRVPAKESDKMIANLRRDAIKVVNENIQGQDITDQYQDIESRLATLQKNKARLETIMDESKNVSEILQVQQQIFMLQDQIDSLIGQQAHLKNTSETVKITAYLSTDEFSLPYVPNTSWRPEVVFKEAVRSLVMDIRALGNRIIWLAVYAVIWVPVLLVLILGFRFWKMRVKKVAVKKRS